MPVLVPFKDDVHAYYNSACHHLKEGKGHLCMLPRIWPVVKHIASELV